MISGSVPGSANDPFGDPEKAFSKLEAPYLSHPLFLRKERKKTEPKREIRV